MKEIYTVFLDPSGDKNHSNSLTIHWFWCHGWCAFCSITDLDKKMVWQLELEERIRSKESQSLRSQRYFAAAASSAWFRKRQVLPTQQSKRLSDLQHLQHSTPRNPRKLVRTQQTSKVLFQAAFSCFDAMFSENDSQELKLDLAEKSVRQRPPSNQWQPTTTTRSGHRERFYHGEHI